MVPAFGRYQVEGELGRGGMGVVLRARAPDGRPVALKLLLSGKGAAERQRRRFRREAEALLRIRHPGVVALLDAGEVDGVPFLALEWVDGESLEARLRRDGPLQAREAARLVREVALALAHCHAQGVLHRDLKPANLLLRAGDGQALLVDFGLTRELEPENERSVLSLTGQALGTPSYWPPEQAEGRREAMGPAADVFGLGGLLFAALTGEPPHAGESALEIVASLGRPPRPPSALVPVPAALDALCLRCLARDPAERPGSAAEVAAALDEWREGRGAARERRGRRLARTLVAVSGAATLVLVAALAPRRSPPPAPEPVAPTPDVAAVETAPPATAALSPREVADLLQEAEARMGRWDFDGAQELARRAVEAAPGNATAGGLLAEARLRLEDFAGAERESRRVLALQPTEPRANVVLGEALLEQGRTQEALAQGRATVARLPKFEPAWTLCARARLFGGDLDGAVVDATRAVNLAPQRPRPWAIRADAHRKRGAADQAIEDASRALELHPGQTGALVTRGEAHLLRGEFAEAIADASRAIELDPAFGVAYLTRGRALAEQGEEAAGLADLLRATQVDPRNAEALLYCADTRLTLGDLVGARRDAERVVALSPAWEASAHILLARLSHIQDDEQQALREADRALALDPGKARAWWIRGVVRLSLRDLEGAASDARAAVEREPKFAGGHALLAEVSLALHDWEGALVAASKVLEQTWVTVRDRAQAHAARACARKFMGQGDAALEEVQRAIACDPSYVRAWTLQADLRLERQDVAGAAADATHATELDPGSGEAWAILAETRRQQNDLPGAIELATRALGLTPIPVRAFLTRALARLARLELAEARDDASQALERGDHPALALLVRGDALRGLGDLQGAVADYRRGLELEPQGTYARMLQRRVDAFGR